MHLDYYLSLLTSEHANQPQFRSVVQLLTNAVAANADVGLSLIDAFDLDQAQGAQLDAIGLWVGMLRNVQVPITGIYFAWDNPPPTSGPVLASTASGALASATYYVRLTYVTAAGESLPGPEASLFVPANSVLQVISPTGVPGSVTGYNVYVSTATGTEAKQNSSPIAIGTNWQEPNSGLVSGAAVPTTSVGTGVGWESGYWQGPFDPTTGIEKLDDKSYRTLIRAKIAANLWDGTLAEMYDFWDFVFGPDVIAVQDNQDMTLTLVYDSLQVSPVMRNLLTSGALPIKPSGVKINYAALSGSPIFSFDVNTPKFKGWDLAAWASSDPIPAPAPPPPSDSAAALSIPTPIGHPVDLLQINKYWVDDGRWGYASLNPGVDPDLVEGPASYQFSQAIERSQIVNTADNSMAARLQWRWPQYNSLGHSTDPNVNPNYQEVKAYPSIICGQKPGYYSPDIWPAYVAAIRAADGVVEPVPNPSYTPSQIASKWVPQGGSVVQISPSGATPGSSPLPLQLPLTSKTLRVRGKVIHKMAPTGKGHVSLDFFLHAISTQIQTFTHAAITHEIMIPLGNWGGYGQYGTRNPGWYDHDVTIDGVDYAVYCAKNSPVSPWPRIVITSASRAAGGVITFTTSTPHLLATSGTVAVSGVSDSSFNGTYTVLSTPSSTTFTVQDPDNSTAATTSGGSFKHPYDPGPNGSGYYPGLQYNFSGLDPNYDNEETTAIAGAPVKRIGWKFIIFQHKSPVDLHPTDVNGMVALDLTKFFAHLATCVDSRGVPFIQNNEWVPCIETGIEMIYGQGDVLIDKYLVQAATSVVAPPPLP